MRLIATLLISVVLAGGIALAGFALLHALNGPTRVYAADAEPRLPARVQIEPGPLDDAHPRVQFPEATRATRGFVVRGKLPADRASVRVLLLRTDDEGTDVRQARPDEGAAFAFADVAPGEYELRFVSPSGAAVLPTKRITVQRDVSVDLEQAGPIRSPVAVRLTLVRHGKASPLAKGLLILSRPAEPARRFTSDERGLLHVDGLRRGTVHWRVWASGPELDRGGREWSGELEIRDAKPIELKLEG